MRISLLLSLIILVNGCGSSIPFPMESDLPVIQFRWNNSTVKELQFGRNIYIDKCSGCHGLKKPSAYTMTEWDTIIAIMSPRGKLTTGESELVRKYLFAKSLTH